MCAVLSCSVVSDSLQPHELWPARLFCPWGFSRQEHWSGLPCPPLSTSYWQLMNGWVTGWIEGKHGHRSTQVTGGTFTHFHIWSLITPSKHAPWMAPTVLDAKGGPRWPRISAPWVPAPCSRCVPAPSMLHWTTGTWQALNWIEFTL